MGIKQGDFVSVEYEGRLESGEIFDSSRHGDHSHPLEFEVGSGKVIRGFDEGVLGMELGEEKEIVIKPSEGYGEVNTSLYKKIPRQSFEFEEEPQKGMGLMISTPDGKQFPTKIIDVDEHTITIDLNHPLAGKTLIFKVKILAVN
jgi:peptidylprolyl isomerase